MLDDDVREPHWLPPCPHCVRIDMRRVWQTVATNFRRCQRISVGFVELLRLWEGKRVRARTSQERGESTVNPLAYAFVGSSPTSPTIAEKQRSVIRAASEQLPTSDDCPPGAGVAQW